MPRQVIQKKCGKETSLNQMETEKENTSFKEIKKIKFQNLNNGEITFEMELLPSQKKFWNHVKNFLVISGGFGCGKTRVMLLRVLYECMSQPDNYFLLGRKTYQEIYDVLLKDFWELCDESWVKEYRKSPHPTVVLNTFVPGKTSTIIFRNTDKLSEEEIKGLNLGGFAIDQAEETEESTIRGLMFRLRRKGIRHRVFLTLNPALTWLYHVVKNQSSPKYDDTWGLIEACSVENYPNLPKDTVERYEKFKETDPAYYRQYVLGVWDESLLAENTVFAREHIEKLSKMAKNPLRITEGFKIYSVYKPGHRYQVGIDPAEGLEQGDDSAITVVDLTDLEEVAHWAGKLPPDATAEKAVYIASQYSGQEKAMIIPEINAMGHALLNKLKDLDWYRVYQREDIDKKTGRKMNKLGWRTTSSTKPLLISHFRDLLRNFEPRIYTLETLDQFKSFIYSDEAKLKGMGANLGYHDDRLMATLLAFWEASRYSPGKIISSLENNTNNKSFLVIEKGVLKMRPNYNEPILIIEKTWQTT